MDVPEIDAEIVYHYEHDFDESSRITDGVGWLELRDSVRSSRHLRQPVRALDVGGTGVHARWLAELGHLVEVRRSDAPPRRAAHAPHEAGSPSPPNFGDALACSPTPPTTPCCCSGRSTT